MATRSLDIGFLMVGDEILQGFTTDTNSTFLAQRLTQLGHKVRTIVIVADEVGNIKKALKRQLGSSLDMIFVCGGLGGTPDDVTIDAISKTLGLPMVRSKKAHAWIKEKVEHYHRKGRIPDRSMTGAHAKMSMVPKGSKLLFNRPGTAPGLVIPVKGRARPQKVVVLPGVPKELRYIFTGQIEGKVVKRTRRPTFFEEIAVQIPESSMEPLLKRYYKEVKDISIGSYPQDDRTVILRVSGRKERVKETIKALKVQLKDIEKRH